MTSAPLLALCLGLAAAQPLSVAETQSGGYTTDAICRQRHCINPVFPGLQDLSLLEAYTWQCQPSASAKQYMQFCGLAVNYDVAIQSPNTSTPLPALVANQERAAATMYRYHLTAMGLEPWDHRKPEDSLDDCVRSVWKMVCATYFPRAEAGCRAGEGTSYLRPCSNVCQNYVQSCGVECCDESAMCVPSERQVSMLGVQPRYVDLAGPSAQCTGAATRGGVSPAVVLAGLLALVLPHVEGPSGASRPTAAAGARAGKPRKLLVAATLGAVAASLQGCEAVGHATSAWESKASYWVNFQYVPIEDHVKQTGEWQVPTSQAVLNSCNVTGLPASRQCSGHGVCRQFGARAHDMVPLLFCECDRDWADPECRTRRKSQATAFALALFTGPLGLDRFYLGDSSLGVLKMASLGGLGVWWLYDVARVGSSPIYSSEYRLAADLPHWLYVFVAVGFFALFGFVVFNLGGSEVHRRKEMARMLMEAEDDWKRSVFGANPINKQDRVGMPRISSHAMPMPGPGPYGTMVPTQVISAAYNNPFSSYNVYSGAVGDPSQMSSVSAPPPVASPPRELPPGPPQPIGL